MQGHLFNLTILSIESEVHLSDFENTIKQFSIQVKKNMFIVNNSYVIFLCICILIVYSYVIK